VNKVLSVLCICLCVQLSAQMPAHKINRISESYQGKIIELGPLQIAQIRSNDKNGDRGGYQFAERRDVNLTPFNSGEWRMSGDFHEWTLSIHSKNALSLNLGFTEYQLPGDASLSIISDSGEIIGPFTQADNKEHLQLWTPIVSGDKLTIILRIADKDMSALELRLSAVNHGYRFAETRSVSGSCNIDILCRNEEAFSLIEKYQDQINSVGVVQVNGNLLCSGFLINNAKNDFTPYFITAAHCKIDERNASSVVVYWNYENSFCRTPNSFLSSETGDGMLNKFNTGAELISSAVSGEINSLSVDFTLIKLNNPVDPNHFPYFAGWDLSSGFTDTTFTVHHPNAEEKRISFDFGKPRFSPMLEDSVIVGGEFIEDSIFVRVLNWELGTTEFGSSGSPLFNREGKAIGLLSGGKASCVQQDMYDEYGWIGLAWENEGTPETRLKDWLDPNAAGIRSLDGLNGSFSLLADESFRTLCGVQSDSIEIDIQIDKNFKNTVDISVNNLPSGVTASFSNASVTPGGSSILILRNISTLNTGIYQIQYEGTDGTNIGENTITLDITSNVPDKLGIEFPQSGNTVDGLARFNWSGNADMYEIEISDNISFSNPIIADNSISRQLFSTSALPQNNEFFWRVRGLNLCGNSAWTEPTLFRTSSLNCTQIDETDLDIQIADTRFDTIVSLINVDKSEPIHSVSVPLIEGTHTYSSDLIFNLISPQGTKVNLANNICEGGIPFMDFKIGFNDQGFPLEEVPCPFTDGRTYAPERALENFAGEEPQGIWTLEVIDQVEFDAGALQNWSLQICSEETSSLFSEFPEQTINACGLSSVNSSVNLSQDFNGPVTITAVPSKDVLDVDLSTNVADPGDDISFTINNIGNLNDEPVSIRFITSDGNQSSESVFIIDFESNFEDISISNPQNNTIIKTGDIIDFDWNDIAGASGYTLQVSKDPLFIDLDKDLSTIESRQDVALDFVEQGEVITVYWRVIAEGSDCSKISEVFSFEADFTDAVIQLENTELNIYPNPTRDQIFIESIGVVNSPIVLELFDISGKRLQTINIEKGIVQETMTVASYPQGIYFLKIKSDLESKITKIIKQ